MSKIKLKIEAFRRMAILPLFFLYTKTLSPTRIFFDCIVIQLYPISHYEVNTMEKVREHWSSRIGFLLAAIGSTVGLGLLWKFPYVIGQNGGGLFLITYFLCVFIVGIPVFIAELILGRRTQAAAITSFQVAAPDRPGWKIAGHLGVLSSFLIMSFYSVISGWGMSYILMSINGFYRGKSMEEVGLIFDQLSQSGGITLLWHFLFTLITMAIVMSGVRKGIEYWSKIMVRILLVLLVALFLYSLTLPGFGKAARFVFLPSYGVFSISSVLEALGLAFMTMSLGQGVMISYGSYLGPRENVVKMSLIIAGSVLIVAILAALTIFPVVFSFGLPPDSGPGLVFKTLPYLFAKLPGSVVISTVFFTLFVFTALTSAVPLIEVVTTNIMELYGTKRKITSLGVSLATFLFGIPSALAASGDLFPEWKAIFGSNFLDTINDFVSIWVIPFAGLFTSLFVGYIMDDKATYEEITNGQDMRLVWLIWRFFIRYIVPVVICTIIIQKSGLFAP